MAEHYEPYFFDENGNVVEKEKAVSAVIRTVDDDGALISETWVTIQKPPVG